MTINHKYMQIQIENPSRRRINTRIMGEEKEKHRERGKQLQQKARLDQTSSETSERNSDSRNSARFSSSSSSFDIFEARYLNLCRWKGGLGLSWEKLKFSGHEDSGDRESFRRRGLKAIYMRRRIGAEDMPRMLRVGVLIEPVLGRAGFTMGGPLDPYSSLFCAK